MRKLFGDRLLVRQMLSRGRSNERFMELGIIYSDTLMLPAFKEILMGRITERSIAAISAFSDFTQKMGGMTEDRSAVSV